MLQRSRTTRSPGTHVRCSVACPAGRDETVAVFFFPVPRILIRLAGTGEANNVTGILCEVNKQGFVYLLSKECDAVVIATKLVVTFSRISM
jgi:hypothetical protein